MSDLTRRDVGTAMIGAAAATMISAQVGSAAAQAPAGVVASSDLPVPAQNIPVPKTISPAAQAFLTSAHQRIAARQRAGPNTQQPGASGEAPAPNAVLQYFRAGAARFKGTAETIDLGNGAKLYRLAPEGRVGQKARVAYFDIHGGGFVGGGGEMCELLARTRAADYGVEVFAVDYRLLPDHPYPAPLDDCVAAYREVLKRHKPSEIVAAGSSAGGNLAAALMLRARDEGLPLPAGLLLLTPLVDMLGEGDSRHTNRFLDVILYASDGAAFYAKGQDARHPYLSPIFGDFTKGWPPTLLSTGTRDLLLSDTVRMHRALRRAGVRADLHVTEAGPHGNFQGRAPEDTEILAECKLFMNQAWGIRA